MSPLVRSCEQDSSEISSEPLSEPMGCGACSKMRWRNCAWELRVWMKFSVSFHLKPRRPLNAAGVDVSSSPHSTTARFAEPNARREGQPPARNRRSMSHRGYFLRETLEEVQ